MHRHPFLVLSICEISVSSGFCQKVCCRRLGTFGLKLSQEKGERFSPEEPQRPRGCDAVVVCRACASGVSHRSMGSSHVGQIPETPCNGSKNVPAPQNVALTRGTSKSRAECTVVVSSSLILTPKTKRFLCPVKVQQKSPPEVQRFLGNGAARVHHLIPLTSTHPPNRMDMSCANWIWHIGAASLSAKGHMDLPTRPPPQNGGLRGGETCTNGLQRHVYGGRAGPLRELWGAHICRRSMPLTPTCPPSMPERPGRPSSGCSTSTSCVGTLRRCWQATCRDGLGRPVGQWCCWAFTRAGA